MVFVPTQKLSGLNHTASITQPQSLTLSLFIESGNVNLRSGPVSTILQNLLEILLACDTDEVDVLTQVSMGCKTT